MGLAKFRCYKPEEEDYINVSIVCSNITRGNSAWDSNNNYPAIFEDWYKLREPSCSSPFVTGYIEAEMIAS